MSRSWRERPAGLRYRKQWRPWVSLRPTRAAGARLHEQRRVGLRDLVAPPSDVTSRPTLRWRVIGSLFGTLLVLLVIRLAFLQVVEHAAAVRAVESQVFQTSQIPADRGQIRDRNGDVLVGNQLTTQLQLSRAQAALNPSVVGALSGLTSLSVATIDDRLCISGSNCQFNAYQPVPILRSTPASIIEYVRLHTSLFPGVLLVTAATRDYPLGGSIAPQVLGYVGPITEAEIAEHPGQGYVGQSYFGQNGIEQFYESFLRGKNGVETLHINSEGDVIGTTKIVAPTVGSSVVLNLDAGLQRAVDTALTNGIERVRTHADPTTGRYPPAPDGAAIVLDPRNGAVLAMASYPGYNVANFVGGLSTKQWRALELDGAQNNYAIQGLYTPGSTFKMVTATAELQTGIFPAGQYVNDRGSFKVPNCLQSGDGCVFHDDENSGAGEVNLPLALTRSSDYYFYNLGYLFWAHTSRYGETPIQNVAKAYGLGQESLIDLPYEVDGRVDSPSVRQILHAQSPTAFPNVNWYTGDNIEMAFGQGATALTPISMADAYATFANGGTLYAPEVAAGVVSPRGRVLQRYAPRVLGHVNLPPSVRDPILQGLIGVVNNSTGTAYAPFHTYATFNLNNFVIAGKTGTADDRIGEEPNSWFIGFGPATDAQYVVLCVIAQGGYGADGSAPVVAQIFNYLVRHPVGAVNFTRSKVVSSASVSVP